jgi:glycosyltransferase involved in cell wall biosynthesis
VSSNAGGISEVNKQGYSGYLSEVGDVKEMADNAFRILVDDKQHQKFKNQALKQARLFDIDDIITQYEQVYTDVLASIQF